MKSKRHQVPPSHPSFPVHKKYYCTLLSFVIPSLFSDIKKEGNYVNSSRRNKYIIKQSILSWWVVTSVCFDYFFKLYRIIMFKSWCALPSVRTSLYLTSGLFPCFQHQYTLQQWQFYFLLFFTLLHLPNLSTICYF